MKKKIVRIALIIALLGLAADPGNIVLNQFSEFANHVGHYEVTGRALEAVFNNYRAANPGARAAAFVSASGSAGTLGAGDWLKESVGARIVAVEALECPTMLYNGFGEHNIQGIGDKHIPLIHNVMNTDVVVGVSDAATDALIMAFNTAAGHDRLRAAGVGPEILESLGDMGLSSICNVLAAIKTAKQLDLGADDVILTVATDGAEMYASERERFLAERYSGEFGELDAAGAIDRHLLGADVEHVMELDHVGRSKIFNLAYFTWVEQPGIELGYFVARRHRGFWDQLHAITPVWDEMIVEFNDRTGMVPA
jgi:cysteine synthase A